MPHESLSTDQVREELRISAPHLVGDLYDTTRAMVDSEYDRWKDLEGKATSLLSAVGVSVAVVSAYSSVAFQEMLSACGTLWVTVPFATAMAATLIAGMVSASNALAAIRVGPTRRVLSDGDVFRHEVLESADVTPESSSSVEYNGSVRAEPPSFPSALQSDTQVSSSASPPDPLAWRKYMIAARYELVQQNSRANDRIAAVVRRGQCAFGWFVLGLSLLAISSITMLGNSQRKEHHGDQKITTPSTTPSTNKR